MSRRPSVSRRWLDNWYTRRARLVNALPATLTWADRKWVEGHFDLADPAFQTVALGCGPTVARPWPCVLDIPGAGGVARPYRGHAPQSTDRGPSMWATVDAGGDR